MTENSIEEQTYGDLYGTDSYAPRYEPDKGFYQRDDRIFHQPGFFYDSVQRIEEATAIPHGLSARVRLESGEPATLRLTVISATTLRLQLWQGEAAFQKTSPMVPTLPTHFPDVVVTAGDAQTTLQVGAYVIQLDQDPFNLRVLDADDNVILELETERIAGKYVTAPLGFRKRTGEAPHPYLSWVIQNADRFFGLGEKFNKVEKSSTRATIWAADTGGSNSNDLSYKSLPVLYSTAGWGLMLHSSFRSYWEVGTFSYTSGSTMTEEPRLDAFLFLAPTLKGLMKAYMDLTGYPAMPPQWAFGIWMSRCMYPNRQVVDEVMARLRAEQIPCDVIHLDPSWMKYHYYPLIGVDACDFEWDPAWPDPAEMFATFKERGFNTCLWINPYLPEGHPIYDEAKAKGYMALTPDGNVARLEFGEPVGVVDLTNPEAKAWWKEHLKDLFRLGASVVKPDYGDRVSEQAIFANGKTGLEMHNLFMHLYAETCYEAAQEARGEGVVWRRSGYIGSQRFPGCWAGDTQVSWRGMRGALRGGLSAGFTGDAFWSHDIGGFVGPKPDPELYIRWAEFGLLSPFSRFHGTAPREPWEYGEAALAIVRTYAQLRYTLIPYLLAMAHETVTTGVSILRHLALEFPNAPNTDTLDDQYMLGGDLLVGPILQAGACSRSLYFPRGDWYAWEAPAERIEGGRFIEVAAPLEWTPLYVRAGAVIPRYVAAPPHLKGPAAAALRLDIYPGDTARALHFQESGRAIAIAYESVAGHRTLTLDGPALTYTINLFGMTAQHVTAENAAVEWQVKGNNTVITVRGAGLFRVNF